jgi:hypothetical protein
MTHEADASRDREALTREVAAIWVEVLALASVPAGIAFVDLGGDSISATLCVDQLQRVLGRRVPVAALMSEDMTLERFVTALERHTTAGAGSLAVESPSPR